MQQGNLELGSGLVKLRSKDQAREYMEALLGTYRAKSDEYGEQMSALLRAVQPAEQLAKEGKNKDGQKPAAKGWVKVGSIPVNSSDPQKALAEVTLKIVDDYKTKVDKTNEALKSLDEIEAHGPGSSNMVFFINRGVPEAVILQEAASRQGTFAFSGSFRAV